MSERDERFQVQDGEIEIVSRSRSGLIVTPEVLDRARARVAAGEDLETVAQDVAVEELFIRGKLDNA